MHSKPVLVFREFPLDSITPMMAYHKLATPGSSSCYLDFSSQQRYSFLGFNPYLLFEVHQKAIKKFLNGKASTLKGDPFQLLQDCINSDLPANDTLFAPFCGGLIGFLSYDAVRLLERIPDKNFRDNQIPLMRFQSYSEILFFDHQKEKMKIAVAAMPDSVDAAQKRIDEIIQSLQCNHSPIFQDISESSIPIDDIDDPTFTDLVGKAKEYLRKGDIFQVVISRTFKTKYSQSPLSLHRTLKAINPSPYHFLLHYPDFTLVGASPEKLISATNGLVEIVPIAGSCPRKGNEEDQFLEEKLIADTKEDAEHMMLVDLARNDLGAVCIPGSVHVPRLKYLQRFSHISHLVSDVAGTLHPSKTAIDALKMAFPAGTLSGAPKIRAMEIIDELENSKRGVYGGAICTFSSNGNMDSCLAIRTAMLKDGIAFVRAGAGIVMDSDPQKEADETRHKARAVLTALNTNQEGFLCI